MSAASDCGAFRADCRRLLRGRSRHQLQLCRLYVAGCRRRPAHRRRWQLLCLAGALAAGALAAAWPRVRAAAAAGRCLLPTNFVLMEATRPVADCAACAAGAPVALRRPTAAQFAQHAYAGRPALVSGAADGWRALRRVDFAFLRDMYARLRANATGADADADADDGCQFLAFRSQLESLDQLMLRRPDDVGDTRWYIGWSNCDPRVAAMLRGLYSWPTFLPPAGEGSAIDWIFMGTPGQGTAVHIDNVHRPSWQAQIRGSKRWRLHPPPECEHVCSHFTVDVHRGQMLLLDTNQWYHGTEVIGDEMSITIGSEYD